MAQQGQGYGGISYQQGGAYGRGAAQQQVAHNLPPGYEKSSHAQARANQYAQPQAGQYAQPQAGQYAQPQAGQYAQPQAGQYAQPQAGQYAQPQAGQYAQPQAGQYAQAQSGQYAQAQSAWQGSAASSPQMTIPAGVDPAIVQYFHQVDADRSGDINVQELQRALYNGFAPFNPETVRLMVNMFDTDRNGTITLQEFVRLWQYVQDWVKTFENYDQDRSGTIDLNEFTLALRDFQFNLPAPMISMLLRKFDTRGVGAMTLDSFIQCVVMLQILTQAFQRTARGQPKAMLTYEQFLEMVFSVRF